MKKTVNIYKDEYKASHLDDRPTNPKTMKATMIQNPNGTHQYMFEDNDGSNKVVKKASKRLYKYMLIGFAKADKGAGRDGTGWFFIGMGNNAKSILNSWKSLYSHCELQVINIEQQ